ncbi:MAG: hypothetical protein LUC30_05100 [Clostridiales bacterium]|nr:hypothetical protein [Clostridiales bacterium]
MSSEESTARRQKLVDELERLQGMANLIRCASAGAEAGIHADDIAAALSYLGSEIERSCERIYWDLVDSEDAAENEEAE